MKLLSDLQSGKTKQPYQTYTVEHGIERVKIKVPKANSARFEQQFEEALSDVKVTKHHLLEIAAAHGGSELKGD